MTFSAPAVTPDDWNPKSDQVQADQRKAYDDLRERCPVAHSESLGWSVFRHADVMRVITDHASYSSRVSHYPAVPNGFDPPEHTVYRKALDAFFTPSRVAHFEPQCRKIARETIRDALFLGDLEACKELAMPFAVRVQSAFLGWPDLVHEELLQWLRRSHAATRSGERAQTIAVAQEFEAFVERIRQARTNARPDQDISTELMHLQVEGRLLDARELASILRNWTVGEIGTIAASIGILLHWLATHQEWFEQFRREPSRIPAAIEEILRMDGPLIANRRRTTRAVQLGGREVAADERISVNWVSANRDPDVFEQPQEFMIDRDQSRNLLYGAGIHVCPGAGLARMELRLFVEELMVRTKSLALTEAQSPVRASWPDAGYEKLRLRFL